MREPTKKEIVICLLIVFMGSVLATRNLPIASAETISIRSHYDLPQAYSVSDAFGDYVGPEYIFTIDENGFAIKYKHSTTWSILGNTIFVYFHDENGNLLNTKSYEFRVTKDSFKLYTNKHTYTKTKVKE